MNIPNYPFTIRELTPDDGGGFLIEFPNLPGCMSDGETIDEAIANGYDAVQCWIAQQKKKIKTPLCLLMLKIIVGNGCNAYQARFMQD
jgi:predicted RNase H-like HicB family nuclease